MEKNATSVGKKRRLARLGSVSVIKTNHAAVLRSTSKEVRPTILEPLNSNNNRNIKTRSDYVKEVRRTNSFPGPILVNENARFVADISDKTSPVTTFDSMAFQFTRKSESSVFPSNLEIIHSESESLEAVQHNSAQINDDGDEEQLFLFDEEVSGSNLTEDSLINENSFSSSRACATSISRTDLSNAFHFDSNNEKHYTQESVLWPSNSGHDIHSESILRSANEREDDEKKDIPNISYETTTDEKATISISIPIRILKDQKHFQSVMDTINNALIKKDVPENEENKEVKMCVESHPPPQTCNAYQITNSDQIKTPSQNTPFHHPGNGPRERHHTTSSTPCITSVLSKTRKRTFPEESRGNREASDLEVPQSLQFKDAPFDNTYSSNAEAEWNSEIKEMLEAALDKIPTVCSQKVEVSTKGKQLDGMDWSTVTSAVSIPIDFHEDSLKMLPSYFVEPVATSEVREALDIIQTIQNDVEKN